jgi:hypothetical protein
MANFWSVASTEPKRSFRWVFSLGQGTDNQIESYFVKSVKKPSFTINEIEHQFVAHRFYYPSRVTWNTCELTFVDPVQPDTSAILANIFVDAGYRSPITQDIAEFSLSKGKFADKIGQPIITALDAEGEDIEAWTLWNAWITALDFGQLDYNTDELVVISMTLRYDYATLQNFNTTPTSKLTPTPVAG